MATTGDIATNQSWNKCYCDYSITRTANGTNPYWRVVMYGYIKHTGNYGTTSGSGSGTLACHGQSTSPGVSVNVSAGGTQHIMTATFNVYGTGAPTLGFNMYLNAGPVTMNYNWSAVAPNISVTTVTYNANGGTGVPGNQKKYWGAALALSSTRPTKAGHEFLGWSTSLANANAGTVSYQPGGAYSSDPGGTIALYASWKILGNVSLTFNDSGVFLLDNIPGMPSTNRFYTVVANVTNEHSVPFYYTIVKLDRNMTPILDSTVWLTGTGSETSLNLNVTSDFIREIFIEQKTPESRVYFGVITTIDKDSLAEDITNTYVVGRNLNYNYPRIFTDSVVRHDNSLDLTFTVSYHSNYRFDLMDEELLMETLKSKLELKINIGRIPADMICETSVSASEWALTYRYYIPLNHNLDIVATLKASDGYYFSQSIFNIPNIDDKRNDIYFYKNLILEASGFVGTGVDGWYIKDGIFYAKAFIEDPNLVDKFIIEKDGVVKMKGLLQKGIDSMNNQAIIDMVYPVGAVFCTSDSEFNPNVIWGGTTWEQVALGKVIVGVDIGDEDFATANKEGGEKTHKLTSQELASHQHVNTTDWGYSGEAAGSTGKYGVSWGNYSGRNMMSGSGGGDEPHNNLQPYVTKFYWERIS